MEKKIRAIVEDFNLVNMDVKETGIIQITSFNMTRMEECATFVKMLVSQDDRKRGGGGRKKRPEWSGPKPEVGKIYKGKIKGIHQFGVFVEILPPTDEESPGLEGLCHVSELHVERVRNCEGFVNSLNTEELEVKLLEVNAKGQLKLSRKAVLEERRNGLKAKKPEKMANDELKVIEEAIDAVESTDE